jgi:hypothetical protein
VSLRRWKSKGTPIGLLRGRRVQAAIRRGSLSDDYAQREMVMVAIRELDVQEDAAHDEMYVESLSTESIISRIECGGSIQGWREA